MSHSATHQHSRAPVVFDEFFELGLQESASPFLTPRSRTWGVNLSLKSSLFAVLLLAIAFALSFNPLTLPLTYLLLVAVYFFAGVPALIESVEDLASWQINIDVLMTLAAFSSVLIGSAMEGGLLLVLFSLSGSIEDAVTAKAKGAISSLKKIAPTKACVIQPDGTIIERSVKDIEAGTKILVKSGEVIPLDGRVIAGASSVNLVHLTGENLPVTKQMGDEVPAGGYNLEGVLTLTVTHNSAESTLTRIIELVMQAQEARPRLQRWFDSLSERYAVAIILLSTFFALSFPFILNIPFLGWEGSVYRALAFLIAASPCALIIAIPIAYLSAVGACARQGILLKGGVTLDALASCRTIAFDKTGTLTTGELRCLAIEPLSESTDVNKSTAIAVAAAMETNAVHPMAKALVNFASSQQIKPIELTSFKTIPGYGLEASANLDQPTNAFIGRYEYIVPKLPESLAQTLRSRLTALENFGELHAVLLLGDQLFLFRFSDTIRPNMRETLQKLSQSGRWKLLMLTGDNESSASKIAFELGLKEYYAGLKPEDKLEWVTKLSNQYGLAMVGDGINDAPALARATVGISMGKVGSSTAVEASDVVLLHDELSQIEWLMSKARQTQIIVKQNLILASAAILLASMPALAGLIPLWLAVVLHEGGTVLVGLNALRLLRS